MDLQKRIEHLERERWLYLALAVLGALAGLVGVTLAVMRSSKGDLVVSNGNLQAQVGYDAKSKMMGVQLYNGQYIRGAFGMNSLGNPQLIVYDATAKPRHIVAFDQAGDPVIQLLGSEGQPRAEVKADIKGGSIDLVDPAGKQYKLNPSGPVAPAATPKTPGK